MHTLPYIILTLCIIGGLQAAPIAKPGYPTEPGAESHGQAAHSAGGYAVQQPHAQPNPHGNVQDSGLDYTVTPFDPAMEYRHPPPPSVHPTVTPSADHYVNNVTPQDMALADHFAQQFADDGFAI